MTKPLDRPTTKRVEAYAKQVGITPEYFLHKIVNEWLDEKGESVARRVQSLKQENRSGSSRSKSKAIPIQSSAQYKRPVEVPSDRLAANT